MSYDILMSTQNNNNVFTPHTGLLFLKQVKVKGNGLQETYLTKAEDNARPSQFHPHFF